MFTDFQIFLFLIFPSLAEYTVYFSICFSEKTGDQTGNLFFPSNTDATNSDTQKHPHKYTRTATKFCHRCTKLAHMHHITKIDFKIQFMISASGQCYYIEAINSFSYSSHPGGLQKKDSKGLHSKCFFLIKIKPALSERYFKQNTPS